MTTDFIEAAQIERDGEHCHVHAGVGRIIVPEEVQLATEKLPGVDSGMLDGYWALCGDMSVAMFDYILENPTAKQFHRITSLNGAGGGKYLVMTSQVGIHQHRFLVPLYEESSINFLIGLCFQPLALMLGRQGTRNSLVLFPDVEPLSLWSFVVGLQLSEPQERFKYEENMALVVREVSNIDRIQPMDGALSVESISLTAVLPAEFPAEFYEIWTEMLRMKPAYEDEVTVLH